MPSTTPLAIVLCVCINLCLFAVNERSSEASGHRDGPKVSAQPPLHAAHRGQVLPRYHPGKKSIVIEEQFSGEAQAIERKVAGSLLKEANNTSEYLLNITEATIAATPSTKGVSVATKAAKRVSLAKAVKPVDLAAANEPDGSSDVALSVPTSVESDHDAITSNYSGPPIPKVADLRLEEALPQKMYKYKSQDEVRRTAMERFALLDKFLKPLKNVCVDVMKEEKESSFGSKHDKLVLMWIHSANYHFERRRIARQVWASRQIYHGLGAPIVPVFAIGLSRFAKINAAVLNESEKYGDIVLLDYRDSYYNLTYKAVGGMRWASKHCPQASVFLKVDDDTLVIPHRLARYVKETRALTERLFIRAFFNPNVIVKLNDTDNKWYVSDHEWPLPNYASMAAPGLAYFLSTDLFPYMFKAMEYVPWLWLEDVWITGALAEALINAGVPVSRDSIDSVLVPSFDSRLKELFTEDSMKSRNICFIGQMPISRFYAEYKQMLNFVHWKVDLTALSKQR